MTHEVPEREWLAALEESARQAREAEAELIERTRAAEDRMRPQVDELRAAEKELDRMVVAPSALDLLLSGMMEKR